MPPGHTRSGLNDLLGLLAALGLLCALLAALGVRRLAAVDVVAVGLALAAVFAVITGKNALVVAGAAVVIVEVVIVVKHVAVAVLLELRCVGGVRGVAVGESPAGCFKAG